jgi:putative DNA primase/helicase
MPDREALAEPPGALADVYTPAEFAELQATITTPPRYSEAAIARDFADLHETRAKYVVELACWFVFDGTRWRPDNGTAVGGLLLAHLSVLANDAIDDPELGDKRSTRERFARQLASGRTLREVERLVQRDARIVLDVTALDRNEYLLNTPAGTIDLRTGVMREHRREDFITACTAVAPGRGGATFSRVLLEIACGDTALVDYLQCALGACCFAASASADHWLMFWYGPGRNGKNTLGDLVAYALGPYARTVPAATLLSDDRGMQHPTLFANLRGLRLAISSELDEGSRWSESRIKSLTGDETISARKMRQDFFEFRRTHRHLVYGNHRPLLSNPDPALAARLHLVPFNADFSGDRGDPTIPAQLREEAPALLQWLITGAVRYFEDGQVLRKCAAVEAATRDYFDAHSTFDAWLAECTRRDPDARTLAAELYKSFADWKEKRGERPASETRWGEEMRRRFTAYNSRGRGYAGVALHVPDGLNLDR